MEGKACFNHFSLKAAAGSPRAKTEVQRHGNIELISLTAYKCRKFIVLVLSRDICGEEGLKYGYECSDKSKRLIKDDII